MTPLWLLQSWLLHFPFKTVTTMSRFQPAEMMHVLQMEHNRGRNRRRPRLEHFGVGAAPFRSFPTVQPVHYTPSLHKGRWITAYGQHSGQREHRRKTHGLGGTRYCAPQCSQSIGPGFPNCHTIRRFHDGAVGRGPRRAQCLDFL